MMIILQHINNQVLIGVAAAPSTNTTNKRKLDTATNDNDTANNNPLLDDDNCRYIYIGIVSSER